MKICLVSSHDFSHFGGVQEHVIALRDNFIKKGHEAKIIAPRRVSREVYDEDHISLGRSLLVVSNYAQTNVSLANPLRISRLLKKERFDIIHLHNCSFFLPIQILYTSRTCNVLTIHSDFRMSRFYRYFNSTINFVFSKILERARGVIYVSKVAEILLPRNYRGLKEIIPNGIDIERFNPKNRKIEKFDDGRINILFVGAMVERKGLAYLLKAFEKLERKFNNLRLIIVGDGIFKNRYMRLAEELNIKNYSFEGFVPDKLIPNYFATTDIFCSPATHGESFGIVLLEAMASGKPVVAFDNDGYKQILTGKGKRFLVAKRNVNTLSKSLEELILDEKLRKEIGRWGLKESHKYSWDKVSNRVLEFYEKAMN